MNAPRTKCIPTGGIIIDYQQALTDKWNNQAYAAATGDTDFERVPSRVMNNWYRVQSFGQEAFAWQKKQRDLITMASADREALITQLKQSYFKPIYDDFIAHGWS